jgi:hypothetical protein
MRMFVSDRDPGTVIPGKPRPAGAAGHAAPPIVPVKLPANAL